MKQLLNFTSNPRSYFGFIIILFAFSLVLPAMSNAQCTVEMVIDDFEDGDASDWGFFGGNNAGGGGGVLADRPKEGSYYFSTGWGGQGTASLFYGGLYKNFDNTSQIMLPIENPYLCFWVLNQSNATVDQYTLQITIREDLDGNGWTNGLEDSFGFDTTFQSSAFDDEWKFISIPIGDFFNRETGGNLVFDGDLDEILFVISGVQGENVSTVEVDFDHIAFCSGSPCPALIPTMGQWGLMVLSMIMLIIGIVVLKKATLFRPVGGK